MFTVRYTIKYYCLTLPINREYCVGLSDSKTVHPFTGKEKDSETGYYYHGARYYDPTTVTGWTTIDPMLDKYLDISPYAYCAWNPMKYVDPDGREIWIINKNGEKHKYSIGMDAKGYGVYNSKTILALNKLSASETMGREIFQLVFNKYINLSIIEHSDMTYANIKRYDKITNDIPFNQEIYFNPYLAILETSSDEILSPDIVLGHELGHVINALSDPGSFLERKNHNRFDKWDNDEELYNINRFEHGLVKEFGGFIRDGHRTDDERGNVLFRLVDMRDKKIAMDE